MAKAKKKFTYKAIKKHGHKSYVEASADGKHTKVTIFNEASEEELKRIFHKDPGTMKVYIDGSIDPDYMKQMADNTPAEPLPVAPSENGQSSNQNPED